MYDTLILLTLALVMLTLILVLLTIVLIYYSRLLGNEMYELRIRFRLLARRLEGVMISISHRRLEVRRDSEYDAEIEEIKSKGIEKR